MGLFKAGSIAARGTLADQWVDFYSADMAPRDLMIHIPKRTSGGANTKASESVITNGSKIVVPVGVACVITDNGNVREFVAEPGEFIFDGGSEPSFFDSQKIFGGVKSIFNKSVERFKKGGETGKDMRVYYINIKEILDNPFGTPEPVPYADPTYGSLRIKYHGTYSFKISNPITFIENLAGTATQRFGADDFTVKVKPEFMTKLNEVINLQRVRFDTLASCGSAITEHMNKVLDESWIQNRGIEIMSVGIQSPTLDEKSQQRVDDMADALFFSGGAAAGLMAKASADALKNAASNPNGNILGFMGMNMAGQSGSNLASAYGVPQGPVPSVNEGVTSTSMPSTTQEWTCKCGEVNKGAFCQECGAKKPESIGWLCKCGSSNSGAFCQDCGTKKPENGEWTCKCGEINKGKFCGTCGSAQPSKEDS